MARIISLIFSWTQSRTAKLKFRFCKSNIYHPHDLVNFVADVKLFVVIKLIICLKAHSHIGIFII